MAGWLVPTRALSSYAAKTSPIDAAVAGHTTQGPHEQSLHFLFTEMPNFTYQAVLTCGQYCAAGGVRGSLDGSV